MTTAISKIYVYNFFNVTSGPRSDMARPLMNHIITPNGAVAVGGGEAG